MDSGFLTSHALAVKQWDDKALYEYQDRILMRAYMGTDTESLIYVRDILKKEPGDRVTIPLIVALQEAGVEDDDTLEGNEEDLVAYDFPMTLKQYRHGMRTKGKLTQRRTAFKLKDQFRPLLTNWAAQKTDSHIAQALASVGSGVLYTAATAAQKNTFNTSNTDRILFGAAVSNYNATHATALANIDSTNDILTCDAISLMKRRAQLCNPKIRPIQVIGEAGTGADEWYVLFAHNYLARDLKNTTIWKDAQSNARERGRDNPLFTGALGEWDGVIVREWPKCLVIAGVGAAGIDVGMAFLCGAQAVGFAPAGDEDRMDAQMTMTEETFDYKNKVGVAVAMLYAHAKTEFNSKQHGVVTGFFAAVAD